MSFFNKLELRREGAFIDAMMNLAEAQGAEIIAAAEKKRAEELEQANGQAKKAEYEVVKGKYVSESNQEFTAVAFQARQELLQYREELVAEMFDEVKENLRQFTKEAGYDAWLAERLEKHAELMESGKPLVVYLKKEDMAHKEALGRVLPGVQFAEDEDILLGGLKVSDGRVLFDETLDERLREEQQKFYESGAMRL